MTDIFLSYSSRDRERVQPLYDALVAHGFSVFWDLETPAGIDWDTWIRQRLVEARCAIVVWSVNSVCSSNVRHEARIAKQQDKILPVLIDSIAVDQFPMGLDTVQAADLSSWNGDSANAQWLRLLAEAELRLTPPWATRKQDGLEAELISERARRNAVEQRHRALRDQFEKEADAQQGLRMEMDHALQQVERLEVRVQAAEQERANAEARIMVVSRELADTERECRRLSGDLQEASATIMQMQKIDKLCASTRATEERYRTDVRVAELTRQLESSTVERRRVEAELASANSSIKVLRSEIEKRAAGASERGSDAPIAALAPQHEHLLEERRSLTAALHEANSWAAVSSPSIPPSTSPSSRESARVDGVDPEQASAPDAAKGRDLNANHLILTVLLVSAWLGLIISLKSC